MNDTVANAVQQRVLDRVLREHEELVRVTAHEIGLDDVGVVPVPRDVYEEIVELLAPQTRFTDTRLRDVGIENIKLLGYSVIVGTPA